MGRPARVMPSGLSGQAGSAREPRQSGELRDDSVPGRDSPQAVRVRIRPNWAASPRCQTAAPGRGSEDDPTWVARARAASVPSSSSIPSGVTATPCRSTISLRELYTRTQA